MARDEEKLKEDAVVNSVTIAERSKTLRTRKFSLGLAEVRW